MLTQIFFDNFKSLKDVRLPLGRRAIFCGPNAAGKSNLAEALDFLGHVVRDGLSYAVAEKGGFYNICFRKKRRARSPIFFRVIGQGREGSYIADFDISINIQARTEAIRSDFEVILEKYLISARATFDSQSSYRILIERKGESYSVETLADLPKGIRMGDMWSPDMIKRFLGEAFKPQPRSLLLSAFFTTFMPFSLIVKALSGLRIFQINPRIARQPGTPSLTGELGKNGENLAAALDYLSVEDPWTFNNLQQWVREVVPGASALKTSYTESKKIGLFLQERGFGTPWYADDLSDGTIMAMALFLALLDRRFTTVLVEEPENSLHPWILRRFLEHTNEVTNEKQVLITTHSPMVVAASRPEELFLIERRGGGTGVIPAVDREPMLSEIIQKKYMNLGDYWVDGGVGAVPETPDLDQGELFDEDQSDEDHSH